MVCISLPPKCVSRRSHSGMNAFKNVPSLAVARSCRMASSSLKAEVDGFDRLHIVRGVNSSCWGLKQRSYTTRVKCLGTSSCLSMKARSMKSFAASSGRRVPFQTSTYFRIGSKVRYMRSTPTEGMSTRPGLPCVLGEHGGEHA